MLSVTLSAINPEGRSRFILFSRNVTLLSTESLGVCWTSSVFCNGNHGTQSNENILKVLWYVYCICQAFYSVHWDAVVALIAWACDAIACSSEIRLSNFAWRSTTIRVWYIMITLGYFHALVPPCAVTSIICYFHYLSLSYSTN